MFQIECLRRMDGSGHGVPGGQGVDDVSGGQDVAGRGIPDPGSTGRSPRSGENKINQKV